MPATQKAPRSIKPKQPAAPRMPLAEVMDALENAGSAQTRKTYARHGAWEPMFGVSFAVLKTLAKRIRVDHELACALWATGNFDARNLAVKVVDPARMSAADLDRWAQEPTAAMCNSYVAHVAAEGPHAHAKVAQWLAAADEAQRRMGWLLIAALAMRDETLADAWFAEHLLTIEASLHAAPNAQRAAMHQALIAIGCRSEPLRKAATAAAKRIGKVEIDHGDTACQTPDAIQSIEKTWAHSIAKGYASPAAHERTRESMRTRC